MSIRRVASAFFLVFAALLFASPAGEAQAFEHNPILFVHGIEGSGAQFESQKMRFISNGYPADWFDEVDYNSTRAVGDRSEVHHQIDDAIAGLQQRTGKSQVDVVAHSLGTTVMNAYLTDSTLGARRRANIGRYINVDGQANNPGVPTLAVWAGRGTPGRNMAGAQNVTVPNQTHVQVCTSEESFVEYYKFLTGRQPASAAIVQESGAIEVAGKALNFPENTGALGSTVEIWPVDDNGQRIGTSPLHSIPINDNSAGGGKWGPLTVQAGQRYEFTLVRADLQQLHIYREPFPRSDYTVRLLQSVAVEQAAGNRPGSSSGVHIRYKELWGNQGSENDQLLIDGLNICTPTLCPISKQVNAFFVYDVNRDGQTDLSQPDPTFNSLPFITGADVFMRATSPPDDAISFELTSRGTGPVRTLNIPNWEAVFDGWSVQWNDFERTAPSNPSADLAVAVSDSPDPVAVGGRLTYTVSVTNNGPYLARGVRIEDQLGRRARFSSAESERGSCAFRKATVACEVGDLAEGESATATIVVRPTKSGTLANTASASAVEPPDPNTTNNTASASTTVTP
jgi:uncharacterized repeat protein (TIGR01451 family)